MARIVATEKLTDTLCAYQIEAPEIASSAVTGQLVMVRLGEQVLFTPHAIADVARGEGTVTIVASSPGPTEDAPSGESPPSVELTGPVGQTGGIADAGKVLCVADNRGIAALYPRLRDLKAAASYTIVVAGYASKGAVYWHDRIEPLADELYVVTDDGSFGIKGPVKNTVRAICQHVADIDRVIALGSLALLKSTSDVTRGYDIPTTISLSAVIDTEDQLLKPGGAEGSVPFDWHGALDIDGHDVDYDQLGEQLGMQLSK